MLLLLLTANGGPVLAKKAFGPRFAFPLDGGNLFFDGRPILGASKTARGLAVAVLLPSLLAPAIGLDWHVGAIAGAAAMAGDLISSFIKRRLGRPSSSRALGLDQIPESLLPTLACAPLLGLAAADMAVVTAVFFVGELVLSRILYRIHLRDQPY